MTDNTKDLNRFERIEIVIRLVPEGRVSSYGDIAAITGGVTPRHVGYALAASHDPDLPWQRIINAQGGLSPRGADGVTRQRAWLEQEGVMFQNNGAISWTRFGWKGPDLGWFLNKGLEVEEALNILSRIQMRHEKADHMSGR